MVKPSEKAMETGIERWKPFFVGQFLDKHLPFFLVKNIIDSM
jgi:hypothetical protein